MKIMKDKKGFSLVELLVVIAIIGILAAIAVPNFLNYQRKSKLSEAKANLGGIRTAEIAYNVEADTFLAVAQNPATPPGKTAATWTATTGFSQLGWAPEGAVYCAYMTAAPSGGAILTDFVGTATCDIDGDSTNSVTTLNKDGQLVLPTAGVF